MIVTAKTMTLNDHCMRVCGAGLALRYDCALQFKQAMSSGLLRGDEFAFMLEHNPYMIGVLARHLNCKHAGVKLLSDEGHLTAEMVVIALNKFAPMIESDSQAVPTSYEERDARKGGHSIAVILRKRLRDAIGVD